MSEISIGMEQPSINQRLEAVLYTLLVVNPRLKTDTMLSIAGGLEVPAVAAKYDFYEKANQLVDNVPPGTMAVMLGAVGLSMGILGRPGFKSFTEDGSGQQSKDSDQKLSIKDRLSHAYNESMIPHLAKAWETGFLQMQDEKPPKEQAPKKGFLRRTKNLINRHIQENPRKGEPQQDLTTTLPPLPSRLRP
jgi:hypothetical protein